MRTSSRQPSLAPARRAHLGAPLLAALLAACASTPPVSSSGPVQRELVQVGGTVVPLEPTTVRTLGHEVPLSVERTWALLPLAYDALGLPLSRLDPAQRLLGAAGVRVQGRLRTTALSRYVNCGTAATGSPNADSYTVTLDVTTQLSPSGPDTVTGLSTAVRASGRPTSTSGQPVNCVTTGLLERRIAELVREQHAKAAR